MKKVLAVVVLAVAGVAGWGIGYVAGNVAYNLFTA
jgi:hypothetical protein